MPPQTVSTEKTSSGNTGAAAHSWEDIGGQHIWESAVQEDEQGRIVVAAGDTLVQAIRKRRKRMEQNDYAQRNRRVVRDMIRYLYVIIDASRWMRQKDPTLPPGTRLETTIQMLHDFVQEYYDQNPLSHLGFVLVKNGEAEIVTQLSSSSKVHKLGLQSVSQLVAMEGQAPTAGGEFSLQNGLEVAGRSLGHQPRYGSREIVVLTAALSTCDPGHILTDTLPKLLQAKIRVSCLALSAEMHVCRKIAEETAGAMGVCMDKAHFRDWIHGQCIPPPALKDRMQELACEMVSMGFPTRTSSELAELVHATRDKTLLARTAYTCPQCQAKNSELPTDCAICGLKLVLAPHLARSFHHLFPVAPFLEVPSNTNGESTNNANLPISSSSARGTASGPVLVSSSLLVSSVEDGTCCFACLRPLGMGVGTLSGEDMLRFQCPECKNLFCLDCDAYLHETLHNCPGCLCRC